MGQNQSINEGLVEAECLQMQMKHHAQIFSEMRSLTYENFKECLKYLNSLSRQCIDPNGKQLIFLVKPGSDSTLLWKATVRVACVRVDPQTRHIEACKFLNLKQFMAVFKTFQSHLQTLMKCEQQRVLQLSQSASSSPIPIQSSKLLQNVWDNCSWTSCDSSSFSSANQWLSGATSSNGDPPAVLGDECSICLDRCNDVILPCTHSFCTPCIEQWNVHSKKCPVCCDDLSLDEAWVLSALPALEDINERICTELMDLTKDVNNA